MEGAVGDRHGAESVFREVAGVTAGDIHRVCFRVGSGSAPVVAQVV